MKKLLILVAIIVAIIVVARLTGGSDQPGEVRRAVEKAQAAAIDGLNRRSPTAIDHFFAGVREGAQPDGLAETQQAYKDVVSRLPGGAQVQIHSFNITSVEVHEESGLAKVTYRLHASLIRVCAAVFAVQFTQDLALLMTKSGCRISGGDTPQIEETTGNFPG